MNSNVDMNVSFSRSYPLTAPYIYAPSIQLHKHIPIWMSNMYHNWNELVYANAAASHGKAFRHSKNEREKLRLYSRACVIGYCFCSIESQCDTDDVEHFIFYSILFGNIFHHLLCFVSHTHAHKMSDGPPETMFSVQCSTSIYWRF